MVKTAKNELSNSVSHRIDEILRLTKLPIQELARMAGINIRSLKGYQMGSIPITLESVLKICTALSIDFHDFCDFNKRLSPRKIQPVISPTIEAKKVEESSEISAEVIRLTNAEKREKQKKHRDQVATIVRTTDYFLLPRPLFQIVTDFANDYNLHTTSERLQAMLQQVVARGLLKKYPTPVQYSIGYHIPRRTWIYFKDENDLKDPEKIFGYNWLGNSIIV